MGLSLPVRAWRLITTTPTLRRLSTLMAVVTFVTLVGLAVLLGLYTDDLVSLVFQRPESWWAVPFWWLAVLLSFALLFVVGAVILPPLLLVPLQDPLSEATEAACGNFSSPPFSLRGLARGTVSGLTQTLARIAFLLFGLALLLPLHLVPGAGSIAYTLLAGAWTMVWLAAEHLGSPMARHLYPVRDLTALLRERAALCLGFGASVYLVLIIPVLNAFFLPLAVVGGTLLFRALRQAGSLGPPPGTLHPEARSRGSQE
ncbi:MAG: EI24 domain-containing protein [Myxococcaceae bacterium]|nr:EI24 domain-containing protein [Myxococcaceae bacterium]